LQVFFFEYKSGNQVVNSEISNHNIQGKFNKIGFQRIPIVVVDGRKPEKVEHKIE
jgi:hypothetical protein